MKITPKDKVILIVFCSVLVLGLTGFFLLRPMIGNWREAQVALADVQAQKESMDNIILCKTAVLAAQNSEEENYVTLSAQMPPVMKTYDVHYLMIDIAKGASVKLNSLTIGNYTAVNLEDSSITQAQTAATIQETANQIAGGDTSVAESIASALMQGAASAWRAETKSSDKKQTAGSDDGSNPIIYKSGVSVMVSGNYENILRYLDGLTGKNFIHIKSFTIDIPDDGGAMNVNFSLEVYMAMGSDISG